MTPYAEAEMSIKKSESRIDTSCLKGGDINAETLCTSHKRTNSFWPHTKNNVWENYACIEEKSIP